MSRPDRQAFLDQVDRKVAELRGSGLEDQHLRWGVLVALDRGLPLRDGIVLREAQRRVEMETDRARTAWDAAIARCIVVLSQSVVRDWIDPIELIGEDNDRLVLTAPIRIRLWVERHFLGLLGDAVRQVSNFSDVRFATVAPPVALREAQAR